MITIFNLLFVFVIIVLVQSSLLAAIWKTNSFLNVFLKMGFLIQSFLAMVIIAVWIVKNTH